MSKANKSRYAILGMLAFKPMSGYELKRSLDQSVANFWSENLGHIYPMLERLHEEGLVERVPGPPPKKVFALSPSGREELLAWLKTPPAPQTPRNELILQLFLGDSLGPEFLLAKVRDERERQRERQAVYARIRAAMVGRDAAETRFWSIALRYGERVTDAVLAWCDECEALIAPP